MKYSKNEQGNWVLTFTSNLNVDDGYTQHSQGDHESEMTLYTDAFNQPTMIEWDNPVMYVTIGIEYDEDAQEVTGYDGVFELPEQAISLLNYAGFILAEDLVD